MLSSKLAAWVSIALVGLAHAHVGPYDPSMYAINGTDPAHPSLYTGISSQPLFMLTQSEYWMHAIHGVLNFPPPMEDILEIVPGGTVTLQLAENARFTTLSPDPILSAWPDGGEHPANGYSITNLGGASISPSGCISAPNLHAENETMAAGSVLAIAYESDPHKVTPQNTVVISVLPHTPWKRIATYQIPEGLPASDKPVHIVWGWSPRHCGQPNEYFYPLLAKVLPGPTPAKTLGIPQPLVYCGYNGSEPSKCVQGPKQMIIFNQADGNNVADADVLDFDGLWAAPGYNPSCGFKPGPQDDIFVKPGSPNALYPPPGANSSVPAASGVPTSADPASSPSDTSTTTDLASGTPTSTNTASSAPSTPTPTESVSVTPTEPAYGTPATTPTESGTPTDTGMSSAPTTSQGSCKSKKRMITRREKHNIF